MNQDRILAQIPNTLTETDFPMGKLYKGKVRDNYLMEGKRVIIATDRISAFDKVIGTLPFKGQILQAVSNFWFEKTENIIENHIIDSPDPNVVIVKECQVLPVEVIVRRHITGSLWRDYEKGSRNIYGIDFPENLQQNHRFQEPIITPSTKAEQGEHDLPISKEEILANGLVEKELWQEIEKKALALFKKGEEIAERRGLILVDTKYEFGLYQGKLTLVDEIHTPDSSRYWYKETYDQGSPKALDKEYVRQWLIQQGFMGDGEIPALTEEIVVESVKRYLTIYEIFLNQEPDFSVEPVYPRIERRLKKYGLFN